LAATALVIGQLVSHPLREALHSFLEAQVIYFLQETVGITALTTPKTVIKTGLWADMKAGASLIVEGAEPLHGADPGGLECHIIAHNIGDVDALAHLIDVSALNQPRHVASLVSPGSRHTGRKRVWRTKRARAAHTAPGRTDR
jgi:hypothetical protein